MGRVRLTRALPNIAHYNVAFKIPKQAFFNFFHALEEGYHNKPCK